MKTPRLDRAFTLIELLVVISIIALLVAVLLPALSAAREAARTSVCLSQQRQLALAALMYANDFDDYTVGWDNNFSGSDFSMVLPPYLSGEVRHVTSTPEENRHPEVLICPDGSSEMDEYAQNNPFWYARRRSSYAPPLYFSSPRHRVENTSWYQQMPSATYSRVEQWQPTLTPMSADVRPWRPVGVTFYFVKTDLTAINGGRVSFRHGGDPATASGAINLAYLDGHADTRKLNEAREVIMHDRNDIGWFGTDTNRISF